LKELFALLNFICPEIFVNYMDLDSFLNKEETGAKEEERGVIRLRRRCTRS
jgi:SWI/SNF-related matrix-associated actin-dependent regulator of chromatin subfamily A member 5